MATSSGTQVIIASGDRPDILLRLVKGAKIGTRFLSTVSHLESRKRWILAEPPRGQLQIDAGALQALTKLGKSLLPVGITHIDGLFERGQTVRLFGPTNREIARGITHYNASDLEIIKGHRSNEIEGLLGYEYGPTVIHRDDLVLLYD